MSRHLWLDPGFGASGDMLLGALLGIGADLERVRADVAAVDLPGLDVGDWSIETTTVDRARIAATRAVVTTAEGHAHRSWSTIDRALADAAAAQRLTAPVADGARATFRRLAEAEAGIHQVDVDEVHFHEVGAIDAIVDIVGTWAALDDLAVTEVACGPVGLGQGTVEAAHGTLPIPAPATAALLTGAEVRPVAGWGETVTPTGAALLVTMADRWGPIAAGTLLAVGRGAGGRNPATHPNVVSALLSSDDPTSGPDSSVTAAVVLATNVDDATPEVLGHTIDALLAAGADDAWVSTVTMKKSRPGHELRVLCTLDRADELRLRLLRETGSLGVRTTPVTKHALHRATRTVNVRGSAITMKVGPYGSKPEHDQLVALSERTGVPVRVLADEARQKDSDSSRDIGHGM